MKRILGATTVAASALLLSGCQSFLGQLGLAPRPAATQMAQLDMSDYFQELLLTAKNDLRNGRTTQAINAFRQATYDPAHAAEAYNGLGVAYAALGRDDLAKQYFAQAVSADPSDPRFARNLARLELDGTPALANASPQTAELPATATQAAAASAPASAQVLLAAPESTSRPTALVAFSGPGATTRHPEVHVSRTGETLALANAPVSPFAAVPHVQAAGLRPSREGYPVYVTVAEASHTSRPAYPIRILLSSKR
jgi:hypothetical protein